MTKRETISDIKSSLRLIHTDTNWTNKQIWTKVQKHSKWLVEKDSNSFKINRKEKGIQIIKCFPVIEVPTIDPCCGIVTNCIIYRTKEKLGKLYEDYNGVLITEVSSIDGSKIIKKTAKSEYKSKKNNPFAVLKDKFYFFEDGYLYGDLPLKVNISGLFNEDVSLLSGCSEETNSANNCRLFLDFEWNITETLEATVVDMVIKEIAGSMAIPTHEKINKNENV